MEDFTKPPSRMTARKTQKYVWEMPPRNEMLNECLWMSVEWMDLSPTGRQIQTDKLVMANWSEIYVVDKLQKNTMMIHVTIQGNNTKKKQHSQFEKITEIERGRRNESEDSSGTSDSQTWNVPPADSGNNTGDLCPDEGVPRNSWDVTLMLPGPWYGIRAGGKRGVHTPRLDNLSLKMYELKGKKSFWCSTWMNPELFIFCYTTTDEWGGKKDVISDCPAWCLG